jgi:hypothetical protein
MIELMGWLDRIKRQTRRRTVERRRNTRYPTQEHLSCPLGDLVDLSASGMRLLCDEKPPFSKGGIVTLIIRAGAEKLPVTGRVVRLRRCGFKQFDLGVEFTQLKPGQGTRLESLARFGFASAPQAPPHGERRRRVRVSTSLVNFYQVLGVERTASSQSIRAAFHHRAMLYHPDRNRNGDAARQFQQIHDAWAVLKDPQRRREYDSQLARSVVDV